VPWWAAPYWHVHSARNVLSPVSGREYYNFPLPPDWDQRGMDLRALDVPQYELRIDWHPNTGAALTGGTGNTKTGPIDYPRSDRHLAPPSRRPHQDSRPSVEQPSTWTMDDDVFKLSVALCRRSGTLELSDAQIVKFREYLFARRVFPCATISTRQ